MLLPFPYHTLPSDEARQRARLYRAEHFPRHDLDELVFSSDGSWGRPKRDDD